MIKKIATITFHNAINVGAVLQSYALQKAIEEMGHKSSVIDYRNTYVSSNNRAFKADNDNIGSIIKALLNLPIRLILNRRFESFLKKIELTNRVKTDDDFRLLNKEFDVFITGSDQVWNPHHAGKIEPRFFLDFTTESSKKNSYAASFGFTEIPPDLTETYKNLLNDFNMISVREASGLSLIRSIIGRESTQTLDPVFLLGTSHWKKLTQNTRTAKPYLLLFCVNGINKEALEASLRIAAQNNLQVINLSNVLKPIKGTRTIRGAGPIEFLSYLSNADYIVTDSFHGTAFSILFNKEFQVKIVEQHGNKNNRSLELMSLLGISNRLIGEPVDELKWDAINKELAKNRQQSLDYLKRVIGAAKDE